MAQITNRAASPTSDRTSRRTAPRTFLAVGGLAAIIAVAAVAFALGPALHPARPNVGGGGGCPSSNAIGNFVSDTNVTSAFTMDGNGSLVTYWFTSTNESSSNGVPGLISYCVYPANGSMPATETAVALGADGTPFSVSVGGSQGFFAYQRGTGNPSNVPLDGAANVEIGNASWNSTAPTQQTILLHINDPGVCNMLYGGNPGTCFVYPQPTASHCSKGGVAPDALHVSIAPPTSPLASGVTLTSEYEVAVVNYTTADNGAVVHVPTVAFRFPLHGGGSLSQVVAPMAFTIGGSGWSNPVAKTMTVSTSTALSTHSAWMTTSNLAVMVDGAPAGFTLEVRWAWIVNSSGTLTSQWSVPSWGATAPDFPSILMPAPYVVAAGSSASPAKTGTFFGISLQGAVDNTTFRTVVEDTNGMEDHCQLQSNPSTTSVGFSVGVPLTYQTNSTNLLPGMYVVHVHDAAGAIVVQFTIQVTP